MPVRSQEPLPGLPRGCRVPKLWAVLDCFPGPQAGSWKGSGAARIRTGAHMGSRACKARTFNHLRHRAGPFFIIIIKAYLQIEGEAERKIFHPLFHFPNGCNRGKELLLVSHAGAGSQDFGPSSSAFLGHKHGAGWEMEHLGYELASTWDPSIFKVRIFP